MGKTSYTSLDEWQSRNYDRITIKVRKGEKEKIRAAAEAEGVSVSRLITDSINSQYPGLLTVLDDQSKKKKAGK